MKKLILTLSLAILAIFFSGNLFAQGLYFGLQAGYGMKASAQNIEFLEFYNYTSTTNSYTAEQIDMSLGKGISAGGALGYMFNENFGAELGISYLIGGKTEAKDQYTKGVTDYTLKASMLRINPNLVIATGFEKMFPYAKFGVIMGLGSVTYNINDNDDGDIYIAEIKLNGGMGFGWNAGLGLQYMMSDNLSLFGELNTINMTYAPTKGETLEATFNGKDVLPNMTTRQKEITFVDSYTQSYSTPAPDSQPRNELKHKLPFGSAGILFGVRMFIN